MFKYLILIIINLNLATLICSIESNDAEFTNIVCTMDNITVTNIDCRLVSFRHKPRSISIDFDIIKQVSNIDIHFEVFKRLNGYQPFVVNYTFHLCQAFKNKGLNPLTKIVMKWILNNSNLKVPCPIKPQHFQVKEFYPDLRQVPSIIPKGRFRADLTVINKNNSKTIILAQFHFVIKDNF